MEPEITKIDSRNGYLNSTCRKRDHPQDKNNSSVQGSENQNATG